MKVLKRFLKKISDRLPRRVAKKLDLFPESGMDYTIVAVKTKNGKIFRQIVLGRDVIGYSGCRFDDFDNPNAELPFRLWDIVDIEWEGYRVGEKIERPESFRDEWKFSLNPQKPRS